MGELEETGRLPGEIVEIYRAPSRFGSDPREVVEVYRQPDPREVVERYSRPVPLRVKQPALSPAPPPRRRKKGLVKFLACVALLLILALGSRALESHVYFSVRKGHNTSFIPRQSEEITIADWPVGQGVSLTISQKQGEELTAQEVYRRLNPTVVTVQCWTSEGISIGTGVIFTGDGYVITNYHVVRGGERCQLVLDSGYAMEACYVAGDENSDIAILKVPPGQLQQIEALPTASFGDSELLVVGDPVYAIGAPRRLRGTLTNGIISAINRDVEVEGRTMTLLQTNAALNSGSSGGPLINSSGQVIGINVAKYMSGQDSVEGLGFAIPSAQLERIVNDLLKWGEVRPEPSIGVMVLDAGDPLPDGSQGILVHSVIPGGAAEAAGVQAGDYILYAEGRQILQNRDLFQVRRHLYIGDELHLTLWRDGEILELTLILTQAAE